MKDFAKMYYNKPKAEAWKKLKYLVLDEVSMLAASFS